MLTAPVRQAYLQGLRAGAPFLLVIVPFALLFGAVSAEAGWSLVEVVAMSVLVVAGASQFTALQLLSENAPTLIVIATALAVNLRLAMYSASLAPQIGTAPLWQRALVAYFLVDQTYGATIDRLSRDPGMALPEKLAVFFGTATAVCPPWYGFTYLGAVAGGAIPPALALDFAVPITFIALFAPALRSLPHLAAAFVSVAGTLLLASVPYNLGLIVAACLAMATGAAVEVWREGRA